ncbi:MAG: AMP-binding protein, partial [Planctomycetota bacterium]|nr:AMP-binding protein [Planctomycetota bacterium]
MSLPNPILSTALARPEHPVLVSTEGSLTASNMLSEVKRRAAWYRSQGVQAKETVALGGLQNQNWILSFHALAWLGATVAPLSPDSQKLRQLPKLRQRLGAKWLLWLDPENPESDSLLPMPEDAPFEDVEERFWPLSERRLLLLSSGSTGVPKVIEITTEQLMLSAFSSNIRLGHALHDRWLACLPLHHVGGLSILFRCAWNATTVEFHSTFDPQAVLSALKSEATLISMVPVMLKRVLSLLSPEESFPATVRAVLLGGSSCPEELLERCRVKGVPVSVTWGMTETASQIATRFPGDTSPSAGAGPVLPFARVDSQNSKLRIRGPLAPDGALLSQDIGKLDSRGRVHVSGRADDIIVSGGENISLKEIEEVLEKHPSIAKAVVIGIPDEEWGQRPAAFY